MQLPIKILLYVCFISNCFGLLITVNTYIVFYRFQELYHSVFTIVPTFILFLRIRNKEY